MHIITKLVNWFHQCKSRNEGEWEGLFPGDIVKYEGEPFLYKGIMLIGEKNRPEPMFSSTDSMEDESLALRGLSTFRRSFSVNDIDFIVTAGRKDFVKIGHISPKDRESIKNFGYTLNCGDSLVIQLKKTSKIIIAEIVSKGDEPLRVKTLERENEIVYHSEIDFFINEETTKNLQKGIREKTMFL